MTRLKAEPTGTIIAREMRRNGFSYREFARRTGLSHGYLCHLVSGTRKNPSLDTLHRISHALDVEPVVFREYRIWMLGEWLLNDGNGVELKLYRRYLR